MRPTVSARSRVLICLFAALFCWFVVPEGVSTLSIPSASATEEESDVVFYYGDNKYEGSDVLTWYGVHPLDKRPERLNVVPAEGDRFGFIVERGEEKKEDISGVLTDGVIKLSNGAHIKADAGETAFDIIVKLKMIYLKHYQPNFSLTS